MRLIFSRRASRQLVKLPRNIRERIIEKLAFYRAQQDPLVFAERLTDSTFGGGRFRIGDYRVIFDIDDGQIEVLKVGHRKDIYK